MQLFACYKSLLPDVVKLGSLPSTFNENRAARAGMCLAECEIMLKELGVMPFLVGQPFRVLARLGDQLSFARCYPFDSVVVAYRHPAVRFGDCTTQCSQWECWKRRVSLSSSFELHFWWTQPITRPSCLRQ